MIDIIAADVLQNVSDVFTVVELVNGPNKMWILRVFGGGKGEDDWLWLLDHWLINNSFIRLFFDLLKNIGGHTDVVVVFQKLH